MPVNKGISLGLRRANRGVKIGRLKPEYAKMHNLKMRSARQKRQTLTNT